jgi:hypothetical protein
MLSYWIMFSRSIVGWSMGVRDEQMIWLTLPTFPQWEEEIQVLLWSTIQIGEVSMQGTGSETF